MSRRTLLALQVLTVVVPLAIAVGIARDLGTARIVAIVAGIYLAFALGVIWAAADQAGGGDDGRR